MCKCEIDGCLCTKFKKESSIICIICWASHTNNSTVELSLRQNLTDRLVTACLRKGLTSLHQFFPSKRVQHWLQKCYSNYQAELHVLNLVLYRPFQVLQNRCNTEVESQDLSVPGHPTAI